MQSNYTRTHARALTHALALTHARALTHAPIIDYALDLCDHLPPGAQFQSASLQFMYASGIAH